MYRGKGVKTFGLSLIKQSGSNSCVIQSTKKDYPADVNGSLKSGDRILRVNGNDVSQSSPTSVAGMIRDVTADPLLLDVTRGGSGTLSQGDGSYSSHAACPYYISHILAKDAEIIFAPYN